MQRLEVSSAVRRKYTSLGAKGLKYGFFESWDNSFERKWCSYLSLKATANKESD